MTETSDARLEKADAFIRKVQDLDRGRYAALKRNAGNSIAEARGAAWFYGLLDDQGRKTPEIYFLVASLIGHNKQNSRRCNFGETMRSVFRQAKTDSTEKRFLVLLDADFDRLGRDSGGVEMAFRLRQLVTLAASKGVGVDWGQLLVDLMDWSRPYKSVQKRWAESFYCANNTQEED
jgi:CRISPR system Cascade subunit CasB